MSSLYFAHSTFFIQTQGCAITNARTQARKHTYFFPHFDTIEIVNIIKRINTLIQKVLVESLQLSMCIKKLINRIAIPD